MFPKTNKEIKSPFSLGQSNSNISQKNENNIPNNNQSNNNSSHIDKYPKYQKYNTSSDFIKMSYTSIPNSSYLKREIKLPLSLNISPLSNYIESSTLPLIDYGKINEIPACQNPKCLAFLNPYVEFIKGGEEWKCNICKNINSTLNYIIKKDRNDIQEINNGTYEFISDKNCWNKKREIFIPCFYFFVCLYYRPRFWKL